MCRSLIVCLALVLGLVSTSFADILIGNFENSLSDNWQPAWEDTPTCTSDILGVGATLGDMSLQVHTSGGYWTLQYAFPVVIPMGIAVTGVAMDVTMLVADPYPGEWNNEWTAIDKMAVNSDGASGWKEYHNDGGNLPDIGGDGNVRFVWGSWMGNDTTTITWDMQDSSYNSTGATYLQLNFALQNPGAGTGCWYIDNVRVLTEAVGDLTGIGHVMAPCPEPMTIAMLGLGSLALIRRKK